MSSKFLNKLLALKTWFQNTFTPTLPEPEKATLLAQLKAVEPKYELSLAAKSLETRDILDMFDLKMDENQAVWILSKDDIFKILDLLKDMLKVLDL